MTMTIELPDRITRRLKQRAKIQHRSLTDVAISLLEDALSTPESDDTLTQLLDQIRQLPPNPHSVIQADHEFTAEFLAQIEAEPSMSLEELVEWQQNWAIVEAAMKRIEIEDAIAEGRPY